MLPFAKRKLERGFRRASAEVGRSLLQAQDAVRGTEKPTSVSLYQRLPEGYIRLLTIDAVEDGTATCRLETYPLHLAPRYDAISYCWGDDKTPATIKVNGFNLKIRKNLLAFLKASFDRRSPQWKYATEKGLPVRPVWIDAICLNQDDDAEKAVQLPLMGEIYKKASRTIVWLGEADEDTLDTLFFIKSVVAYAEKNDDITHIGKDYLHVQEWEAVRRYFHRPWFYRLWVVQEVLLSDNIEILCCTQEAKMIPWKEIVRFERIIQKRGGYFNLFNEWNLEVHGALPDTILFMETLQSIFRRSGHLKMSSLREYHYFRVCQEPVDRVWGLLGLLSPELVAKVHEAKIIDYSHTSKREYWRSYVAFMKVLHAFDATDFWDVITGDISRKQTSHLPSWCVDFNASRSYAPFRWKRKFRAGFVGPRDSTPVKSSLTSANNALSVSGFYVDDVSLVTGVHEPFIKLLQTSKTATPVEPYSQEMIEQVRVFVGWILECYALCCKTLGESRATKSAMCYTMLAADKDPETLDFARIAAKKEQVTEDSILVKAHFDMIKFREAVVRGTRDQEFSYEGYFAALGMACNKRKVFATSQGRIGLGPPDLRPGDQICAFVGEETLFALRRADRGLVVDTERLVPPPPSVPATWRLIGDAYVHGLMFGEAFTAAGRGPTRDLVLV